MLFGRMCGKKYRSLAVLLMLVLLMVQTAPAPVFSATYVRIRNSWTNQYLYESNGQVAYGTPAESNQLSHWEIVDYYGYKRIRNRATGNYMNIETTSGYLDSVKCGPISDDAWSSHWTVLNGTVSGTKVFQNRWRSNWYLHMEDQTGYAQCSQIPPDWGTVQWYLESVEQSSGLPDLVVTDISWSPANPVAGNEVIFSATIKNQGTGATPSGVKHGLGFFVDDVQVSWNDQHYSSIPPGGTVVLTANWGPQGKASWTAAGGTHTVRAYIDDTFDIAESNENNNVYEENINVSDPGSLPDGLYRIRNLWQSNQYLYEAGGQVRYGTPSASDTSSHWALVDLGGNRELWNRATGNYITIDGITSADSPLTTSYTDTSAKAQFKIEPASTSGYYLIRSVAQSNWYVNIEGLKGYAQCYNNVQPGWSSPQWAFEYIGEVPSRPGASPTPSPDPSGRGADLPFKTYEAEDAVTNGTILGPSRTYREIPSEASNRKAVRLNSTGQYVEFTLTEAADSMVIRYCIPDAPAGGGINATISMYVNGTHYMDIPLTSKYSWVYGEYPWTNNPANGNPHRFFDETRVTFNNLSAGTKVRLQKDSGDTAACYIIDLVDFEKRPAPLSQPANSLSITSYGAVPNDGICDKQALINCISAAKAQGKTVWIPQGTFNLNTPGYITVDNVTIRGAGMWYSTLEGIGAAFALNGDNCRFYDFAIFGDTTRRDDSAPETAFDGNAGTGSIIQNIWAEHLKCGVWANAPTNGLKILNSRFRNTFADGVNLCGGTKNSLVENCHFRNTGDDSIAVWSAAWISPNPSEGNIVRNNTVQSPWLANCIAVYGGKDNIIENNIVRDTVAFGGGINVSSNFDPVDFSGTTIIRNNLLERTGSYEWNLDYARGALWIWAANKNINGALLFSNNDVVDSTYQGIMIEGPYTITNLTFENIRINGSGTYGIHIRSNANGSATFRDVSVTGAQSGGFRNESSNFTVHKQSGNTGW